MKANLIENPKVSRVSDALSDIEDFGNKFNNQTEMSIQPLIATNSNLSLNQDSNKKDFSFFPKKKKSLKLLKEPNIENQ